MTRTADLARLEAVIDTSGVACRIEALLPTGVRPRQLSVRTLLLGMLILAAHGRPSHLRGVHQALISLPDVEQRRLGVLVRWKSGSHRLTYRQTERTFSLVVAALAKDAPDGAPSELLQEILDRLLEASVKICGQPASNSYAVDWTDLEAWARPPTKNRSSADGEAAWGHRTTNHPSQNEAFFGYYLQPLTTVKDERGPDVPELVRRLRITGCQHDPPQTIVPVIRRMHKAGVQITDLLADSGYSYRQPQTFALPVRALGIGLVMDLHSNDRGPKGTHMGAIACNGNLYCPATPNALLELSPLPPGTTQQQAAAHDRRCQELKLYKLGRLSAPDPDGYHRVACPAITGKLRCPLRPPSMTLPHDHPTIPSPPGHPPVCCTQKTITVPPTVCVKTAQKHDYPSPQHRASYNRRTASERTNATIKDPATNDTTRGFCRITSLTGISLLTAAVIVARNLRIADTFDQRQRDAAHRAARHTTRPRRRRQTLEHLLAAANSSP